MSITIYPLDKHPHKGFEIITFIITEGEIKTSAGKMRANDFAVVNGENVFEFETSSKGRLFLIQNPVKLDYQAYAEN